MPGSEQAFIIPLGVVLFPGGTLPLKVFEQRYIEMTKLCLRDARPFGVCLIKEGREVGTPAVPEPVGCLARIKHWEMPQLGIFHLLAEGTERFRIRDSSVLATGLTTATIETLREPPASVPVDPLCKEMLEAIIAKAGDDCFPRPHRLDDAAWTSYRLCEVLPLPLAMKQQLLQIDDAGARLEALSRILARRGEQL
jgi:Lon protease-like protein